MEKIETLYAGKAKTLYTTAQPDKVIAYFRDDTSAFDGTKKEQLASKGAVNNQFNAFIMTHLEEAGIATHFIECLNPTESLCKKLAMLPVECVVRNVSAGGLCRRLGVKQGLIFEPPLFELFLKNDELHDPMITSQHAEVFGWASAEELIQLKRLSLAVNDILQPLFRQADILLVDFKLEFGRHDGQLLLGDEFTPDGCRLWDVQTQEKFDKDRFRQDLGDVVESYRLVAQRLGVQIN